MAIVTTKDKSLSRYAADMVKIGAREWWEKTTDTRRIAHHVVGVLTGALRGQGARAEIPQVTVEEGFSIDVAGVARTGTTVPEAMFERSSN
jgi:hypothetical protein